MGIAWQKISLVFFTKRNQQFEQDVNFSDKFLQLISKKQFDVYQYLVIARSSAVNFFTNFT